MDPWIPVIGRIKYSYTYIQSFFEDIQNACEGDICHVTDKIFFSARDWDEFICQLQQKFNLKKPVMKNYRIDYQIKDKDGKLSPECYGLTEDDEFQYALTGIGQTRPCLRMTRVHEPPPVNSLTQDDTVSSIPKFSEPAVRGFLIVLICYRHKVVQSL